MGCSKSLLQSLPVEDPTKLNEVVCINLHPVMECLFKFVAFALGLLMDFNVDFQDDKPLLFRLKQEILVSDQRGVSELPAEGQCGMN